MEVKWKADIWVDPIPYGNVLLAYSTFTTIIAQYGVDLSCDCAKDIRRQCSHPTGDSTANKICKIGCRRTEQRVIRKQCVVGNTSRNQAKPGIQAEFVLRRTNKSEWIVIGNNSMVHWMLDNSS